MKGRSASKIKLTSYDELLGGGEETNDIQQVSLEHLHSFENHPFQVNDDEAMAELVESVKEEGILTALLVRPLGDGEYEIIAGHRRRHAAHASSSCSAWERRSAATKCGLAVSSARTRISLGPAMESMLT